MKKNVFYGLVLTTLLLLQATLSFAQDGKLQIAVTPDHADWLYKVGEKVKFDISVTRDKKQVKDIKIKYTLGYEKMQPYKTEEAVLG